MKMLSTAALFGLCLAASAQGASFTADGSGSKLEFSGMQAGAEFKGAFKKFNAAVDFAPDALPSSKLDVLIDLNSEDSKDGDRDKTMKGPDVLDVAKNPSAHYLSKSITKTATGYAATGALTLHGVTKDVPLAFTVEGDKLTGTAQLKRLEFGVGQGDWKSTEWIADLVKINFTLVLKPKT